MLARPSASRAGRSCSRNLLRTTARHPTPAGARPFCGESADFFQRRRGSPKRRASASALAPSIPEKNAGNRLEQWQNGRRLASTDTTAQDNRKGEIYSLIDKTNQNEAEMARLMDELDLLSDHQGTLNFDGPDPEDVFSRVIGHRNEQALEAKVQMVRKEFGDYVPEGYLSVTELQLYTRLYGEPIVKEEAEEVEDDDVGREPDRLYRQDGQGEWEEIEHEPTDSEDDIPVVYDMEAGPPMGESIMMQRAREVAKELDGDLMQERSMADANRRSFVRTHPRTVEGRSRMDGIVIPVDTMSGPISAILSDYPNPHIYEAAHQIFGGKSLPHSTTTLPPAAQVPQLPIPLRASQRHMTEMEGNAFIAVLYPGIYASALTILSEIRKRLGTSWIRRLISKEGGPHVLDVGGGGAGILAWRDVIRAEWSLMTPDHPKTTPIPMGKSTVVTGSDALQMRASAILDNTSFLPRLPDYAHVRDKPTLDDEREPLKRKQYDVIIAPYNLLGIEEDFLRKEHVENLWSLLRPDGGILILFEKGRQKGFEAVAGAREMILNRYISTPGSAEYANSTESPDVSRYIAKETGMIVAPCTNHGQCPMYRIPGPTKGRRDYCHFQQRYYRPDFLQRIKGATDRNHEDVEFSYIAVQRGVDLREKDGIVQGQKSTDTAFAGYEHTHAHASEGNKAAVANEESTDNSPKFHTLSLPRIVYPPLKRKGHVTMDVCTPAGEIERWTVPRSYSRQAYKDARKSRWGDLWAMGAKTRIPRNLKIGSKDGEGKKERLARRAAAKAAMKEDGDPDEEGLADSTSQNVTNPGALKKKGQTIPRWKKKTGKRKARQAAKDAAGRIASGQVE